MSDTRALLNRIASFRERLERTPNLVPGALALDDPEAARARAAAALAGNGELVARSLRAMAGAGVNEGPLPDRLTVRARKLLEDARGLVDAQRRLSDDPLLAGRADVA